MEQAFKSLAEGWFVCITKPNEELRARHHLVAQGFEVWVPLYTKPEGERTRRERPSDIFRTSKKSLVRNNDPTLWPREDLPEAIRTLAPLFPRYIFVELGGKAPSSHLIRSTRGCVDLIRKPDGEPSRMPDGVMQSLKSREHDGVIELEVTAKRAERKFQKGERVEVQMPGLSDPAAKFLRYASGRTRAWVLMTFLGEETQVQLPVDSIVQKTAA